MPFKGRPVYVAGVGMTKFDKPRNLRDYDELGVEATTKALLDAGITYDEAEQAFVGYCYGDSTCDALGMTGIPIQNVNVRFFIILALRTQNNCSTGSSALYLGRQMVAAGICECVLVMGMEKMEAGSLGSKFDDRANPLEKTIELMSETVGMGKGPFAAQIFGGGGQEYVEKYGATWEQIGKIAAKNHHHSVNNPYSQFRNDMTLEQVMKDPKVTDHMTRAMCCPTSDGAAAAIVCSEAFLTANGRDLRNQAIEIVAMATATDSERLYEDKSMIELAGSDMTRRAAREAYAAAGIGPTDVKVIELHDCFAANELLCYSPILGVPETRAGEIVDRGDNTYGGKWVINPSGGLESKGHPLGATGIGMIFYLAMQLRGKAGPMQVEGATDKYALAHNLGLGGSCVVSILKRPSFFKEGGVDGTKRLGYEFGYECRTVTPEQIDAARSKKHFSRFASAHL